MDGLKNVCTGNDVGTNGGVGKGNCGDVLDIDILAFSVISGNTPSTVLIYELKLKKKI